jgi:cbb3-type cytochrome oxidase maturation protein
MLAFSLGISTVVALFLVSAMAGVAAWFIFVWAIKDRQFEDVEDVALRIHDLDDAAAFDSKANSQSKG